MSASAPAPAAVGGQGVSFDESRSLLTAFRDTLARFGDDHIDPIAIDAAGAIPGAVLAGLADLGAFGVSLPARHGGAELGLQGACAVVEVLARRDRSVATTVGLHLGLGTRGLVAFGSEAQQQRLLPRLAAGQDIAAFSTTEPGAGSDLSALGTMMTQPSTGRVQLNGYKIFVTNGGLARVLTVAASSPGSGGAQRGQSLVVLHPDDPGVRIGVEERKLGLRGSSTTELFMQDVDVPASRVLGEAGAGQTYLRHILAWGRTVMAAGCNGTSHAALRLAASHVCERRQFGRSLAAQPVVRAQIAEMAAWHFAAEAIVAAAAAAVDDAETLERRSLGAKVLCSEASGRICDMTLQLHGGLGYIEESGVPLLLRDTRITRIFEGANDVLLTRLGMIGLAGAASVPATPIAAYAEAQRSALAARGLKAVRDKRRLHRLGRLIALRDAEQAVIAMADLSERRRALAAHWMRLAERRADSIAHAIDADASIDQVAEAVFEGATA